jgi:N-formylglutamate deformylase
MADNGSASFFEILAPSAWTAPAVFNSPHSGRSYPADLLRMTRLSHAALRKSEDCYIDELFMSCVDEGAPLLRALVPRAYIDLNREAYEFDPACCLRTAGLHEYQFATGCRRTWNDPAGGGRREIYRERLSLTDAWRG